MSYPLINGTVINGASTGVQQTQGLQPVRFGRPVLAVSMQAVDGVAGVTFGVPKLKAGTDHMFTPPSIHPVRFGDASLQAGVPPNSTMLGVSSLRQAVFGKPAVSAALVLHGLAPLQPVGFGHAVMRARLTVEGLAATTMGTPGQVAHFYPHSLRSMVFGGPCMAVGLPAASTAKVRFGRPRVALATAVLGAASLGPVRFSTIAMAGISLRARTLTSVSFGRPAVDRGAIC